MRFSRVVFGIVQRHRNHKPALFQNLVQTFLM
jgi:hypothetical protein